MPTRRELPHSRRSRHRRRLRRQPHATLGVRAPLAVGTGPPCRRHRRRWDWAAAAAAGTGPLCRSFTKANTIARGSSPGARRWGPHNPSPVAAFPTQLEDAQSRPWRRLLATVAADALGCAAFIGVWSVTAARPRVSPAALATALTALATSLTALATALTSLTAPTACAAFAAAATRLTVRTELERSRCCARRQCGE